MVAREWADVFVPALDERLALEAKALFFVPTALERCSTAGLSPAYLGSVSSTAAIGKKPLAGRAAITKVLSYQPVTYKRAVGFINVANHALQDRDGEPLRRSDIVACIFRLRDPEEIAATLEITPLEIEEATGLSAGLVAAALARFRLQLHDALEIWRFFNAVRKKKNLDAEILNPLTDLPQDFIRTDDRYPLAVKQVDDGEFIYGWGNLKPAPRFGHFWAIEEDNSPGLLV